MDETKFKETEGLHTVTGVCLSVYLSVVTNRARARAGAGWPGQTPARCFQLQIGQGQGQGQGRHPLLFSVIDKAGARQGSQGEQGVLNCLNFWPPRVCLHWGFTKT